MDFRNGTYEHGILPPQGVFPESAVHKIPAHGEIKGGGEERNAVWHGEKGRRAECDTGERFSSAASHPVRVTVEDLKTTALPHSNCKKRNVLGETKFRPNVLYHQSRLS